jgi:hypothetical protein
MSEPIPDSTAPAAAAPAPAPVALEVKLPPKVKKPRSVAQREATAKALAILSERREKKKAEMVAVSETKEIAKEVIKKQKKSDPSVEFVTKSDLEGFMSVIEAKMNSKAAAAPAAPVTKVLPTAPSQVVKPLLQRAPTPIAPVKLTGHALLDSLFFPNK